jgi:hypothetical protein
VSSLNYGNILLQAVLQCLWNAVRKLTPTEAPVCHVVLASALSLLPVQHVMVAKDCFCSPNSDMPRRIMFQLLSRRYLKAIMEFVECPCFQRSPVPHVWKDHLSNTRVGCLNWNVPWFTSVPLEECRDSTSKLGTTASLCTSSLFLFCFVFIFYLLFRFSHFTGFLFS